MIALVTGHVLGLVLAHDRAIALWTSARAAVRSQLAMLAVMVAFTGLGLWAAVGGQRMSTFAHAGHWAIQLLYVVPVILVIGAIVWSEIQERREEQEERNADLDGRD